MRASVVVACCALAMSPCRAGEPAPGGGAPAAAPAAAEAKPKIVVAEDGFPTGHDTPEGIACDFARAFIRHDADAFRSSCIRLYANGGKGPSDYAEFLDTMIGEISAEAARNTPSPEGPKSIGKVFASRALSHDGPASMGFAAFDFEEVKFVDVGAFLHNGKRNLNRTLVIKDNDGKWYVHPMPDAGGGLLGVGLNEETSSTKDFSEVYEVEKGTEEGKKQE